MTPKILVLANEADAARIARDMAPAGFDVTVAASSSAEYRDALGTAEYFVALPQVPMDETLYRAAPRLRLLQLLSAGYDRCDIEAARRAGVLIANNGGANAI